MWFDRLRLPGFNLGHDPVLNASEKAMQSSGFGYNQAQGKDLEYRPGTWIPFCGAAEQMPGVNPSLTINTVTARPMSKISAK